MPTKSMYICIWKIQIATMKWIMNGRYEIDVEQMHVINTNNG